MAQIVNAVTKYRLTDDVLKGMSERALNKTIDDFNAKELAGGFCNAVYLVEADGEKMVLKIASPKDVVVMRHERDYVTVEAKMLELFTQKLSISAPKLIYFDNSMTICPVPYFFMSFMEGRPLMQADPKPDSEEISEIKYNVGQTCRQISSIKCEKFGIPAIPESYTHSNFEFVAALFKMLFMDARDKSIQVPTADEKVMLALLDKCKVALDQVTEPVYIHTDTWDGNIMVKNGKFVGMIDFAAILMGDPLMNHDFHDFNPHPNKDFCRGFGKETFTQNEWIRIVVYRLWQRLGMIVERGFRGYEDPNTYSWVLDEYTKEVKALQELLG